MLLLRCLLSYSSLSDVVSCRLDGEVDRTITACDNDATVRK